MNIQGVTLIINGIVFLKETLSSLKDKQKWKDDFKGPLFFHMEKVISVLCQLAIGEQKRLK